MAAPTDTTSPHRETPESAIATTPRSAPDRRAVRWDVAIAGSILAAIVGAAIVGPFLTMDPNQQSLRDARLGLFSPGHLLGTDAFGRDILARTLDGARVSLLVGFSAVAVCLVVGGTLGLVAGYWGGWLDTFIMRVMDMILAFPTLVLALSIAAFLGPSLRNVVLAVSFSQLPQYARLSRATTIGVRERDFVLGSQLLGARRRHTVTKHVLPNVVPALVTYAMLAISIAIIIEASLSFLGLGVRPPTPSWGAMIAEGRPDLQGAAHIVLVPGFFLFLTTLSLNIVADGVRAEVPVAGGDQ